MRPSVNAFIFTDDASPSFANCIMADCFERAAHNFDGIFSGRPRLTGDKPTRSNVTASRKVDALILRSLGEESMLSLNIAAIARAPWPRLPLVESSLRESLNLIVAFLNALEYRSP
jgi:hypothetical protein